MFVFPKLEPLCIPCFRCDHSSEQQPVGQCREGGGSPGFGRGGYV